MIADHRIAIATCATINHVSQMTVDPRASGLSFVLVRVGHATQRLVFDDAPPASDVSGTIFRSLWQHNLQAIRAEQMVNWQRGRSAAAKFIGPTAYA